MMLPIALYRQQSETFPVELILHSSSWISFLWYYSISRVTEQTCSGKCLWGFLVQPHMQSSSGSVFISFSSHGIAMPRGKPGWHGCPGSHFFAFSPESVTLQHLSQGAGRKLSQGYCHSSPVPGLGTGDGRLDGTSTDRSEGLRERKNSSDWNPKDQIKSKQEEKKMHLFFCLHTVLVCLFLIRAFHVYDPDLLCWPICDWNRTPYFMYPLRTASLALILPYL